jgi:ABC-2 type transport system permease protein
MTNGIIGVTATVSEYRRNGIIKRLAATPVGKGAWILANLLYQTFLAFCLMAVMIGLGFVMFGFSVLPDLLALTFTFIGAVAFCCIGIILGGLIKDVEAATGAGNAIAFPMMFLSGAFWPLDLMPDFMQTVAKSLPLYYYHEGLRQIMIYQNPQASLIPFLVMGVMAIIFILLAIKVTKWKELD